MPKDIETVATHSLRLQYFAVIIANIISFCHGCAIGWLSPAVLRLESAGSPLESGAITLSEKSWIGSYFSIGAIIGNCVFGVVSNYVGRKNTLCMLAIPNVLFWLCILNGTLVSHLYIGRILAGSTGGGMYICIPLFVAEIADSRIRGRLGSLMMLTLTTGILLAFVAGSYLEYSLVPKIFIALPVVFFVAFILLPETPEHFLYRNNPEKAKQSLRFYRNCRCSDPNKCNAIEEEFAELVKVANRKIEKSKERTSIRDLFEWKSIKAILIGVSLTAINLFSGTFAMLNYTASIFQVSGSDLDPHISAIVIAAIQIVGVYGSTSLVDRVGRKTLLTFSTCGAFVGLASLGTYSYLTNEVGMDLSHLNWVPLISFSTFMFISCFGIVPLPFIVLTEILPAKVRRVGQTLCMLSNSIFAFISLKTFPLLMSWVGLYGVAWICSAVCLYGIFFSIFILKETKGKNLNTTDDENYDNDNLNTEIN